MIGSAPETNGIKALAFDTGGTILDWHGGLVAALSDVGERRGIARDWHELANEYRRRGLRRMLGAIGYDAMTFHLQSRQ